MDELRRNVAYLCDKSRMLTGISVAYGTNSRSESLIYGYAQEVMMAPNETPIPCKQPLKKDALFDLASLTKLFTCVLSMQLVEDGILSLEETVSDIDSRFIHLKDVRIFDVLSFRACLQTPGRIDTASDRVEGLSRLFQTIRAELPRIRLYSDINAMVMKYIIEQKTGLSFRDALHQRILSPLSMTDTDTYISP